ncbi:MAG: helix-turn-helix domain-containing protein [Methanomicrobiales archaeon]|nr:helix-turn-helix domain-containing protein [Methanomicrobiales archaeon]
MDTAAFPAAAGDPFEGRDDGKRPDSMQNSALTPRLAWMMCYEETGSAMEVCRRFAISRKTFYKWLKRYKESSGKSNSLDDRSRRPHHFPRATPKEEVELLKQAKQQTGFGQRRLRVYMAQKYNINLSERTIWKILKREHPVDTSAER